MTAAEMLWVRELESLSGYKDLLLVFTEQDWWVSVIGDNESQQEMMSELEWHFARDMHEIGDLLQMPADFFMWIKFPIISE